MTSAPLSILHGSTVAFDALAFFREQGVLHEPFLLATGDMVPASALLQLDRVVDQLRAAGVTPIFIFPGMAPRLSSLHAPAGEGAAAPGRAHAERQAESDTAREEAWKAVAAGKWNTARALFEEHLVAPVPPELQQVRARVVRASLLLFALLLIFTVNWYLIV